MLVVWLGLGGDLLGLLLGGDGGGGDLLEALLGREVMCGEGHYH